MGKAEKYQHLRASGDGQEVGGHTRSLTGQLRGNAQAVWTNFLQAESGAPSFFCAHFPVTAKVALGLSG